MTTRKRRKLSETLAANPTGDDDAEEEEKEKEVEDYMSMEIVEPRVVETPASRALRKRREVRGFFFCFGSFGPFELRLRPFLFVLHRA